MIKISKFIALLTCLSVFGCTFQSRQYELVKALLVSENIVDQKQWVLHWKGYKTSVYPVTVKIGTVFTDGDQLLIKFNGWNIFEIRGLPGAGSFDLRYDGDASSNQKDGKDDGRVEESGSLVFYSNEPVTYRSSCSEWVRDRSLDSQYRQTCKSHFGYDYQNSIILAPSGNIIRLGTFLGPEKHPLEISES
jgi:hypothetical protein